MICAVGMARPHHVKEAAVRSLFTVGCRGKRKSSLSPAALKVLTALFNVLVQESLLRSARCAAASGRATVALEDFQRIVAQLMLDFCT